MNKYVIGAVVIVGVFICGYQVGISSKSSTSVVQTETDTKQNDVTTITKEIKKPDGTVETTTKVIDKTKETDDKKTVVVATEARTNLFHVAIAADHIIKGTAGVYSVSVERVLLGNFTAGIKADTDKNVGIVLGINF